MFLLGFLALALLPHDAPRRPRDRRRRRRRHARVLRRRAGRPRPADPTRPHARHGSTAVPARPGHGLVLAGGSLALILAFDLGPARTRVAGRRRPARRGRRLDQRVRRGTAPTLRRRVRRPGAPAARRDGLADRVCRSRRQHWPRDPEHQPRPGGLRSGHGPGHLLRRPTQLDDPRRTTAGLERTVRRAASRAPRPRRWSPGRPIRPRSFDRNG